MEIQKSLDKLYSLHTFGIKLGLDNIQKFLNYIGNPQKEIKTFHIAGSNGKGSTASFIASILTELKYETGLYTSPHFIRFNERIKINNTEIPDSYVADFVSSYQEFIDENKLTFFEVTTAMAFKYFMEQKVDYAVIETGLGGRLDATNVLNPLASVITTISLEHTNILGNTIKDIAGEKAAIIKSNSKVFIGKLPRDAEAVVDEKCKSMGCELFKVDDYFLQKGDSLKLFTGEFILDDKIVPLKGKYQKYNAALAGLTVSKTLSISNFKALQDGIKNLMQNTGLQGRYEFFKKNPDIIFDSAHNPEGIKSFIEEFKKDFKKYSKRTLLFGVMKDKDIKKMLLDIKGYFDEIYITEIDIERASKIEELLKISSELNLNVKVEKEPEKLIAQFESYPEDQCLVVLGSMYLIGAVKTKLINKST
jgi:dihydrofolate synthase/folylpolyglutamate synthase